jgi:predicted alpha/beta-fold hydrolase
MPTMNIDLPPFRPLSWLRGGHAQTLAGFWMPGKREPYEAQKHRVLLADGDSVILHDDCPESWQPGNQAALLLPGLCGSYKSAYMVRIAAKLKRAGVRAFRMDQRGCGASRGWCRRPYHAGLTSDVAECLLALEWLCPGSPVNLVGFSMGGNLALMVAGENCPDNVQSILAFNPPIDLGKAAAALQRPSNCFYNRYFVKWMSGVTTGLLPGYRKPEYPFLSVDELNEFYLTKVWNFGTLKRYYNRASAIRFLPSIQVPTLIVTAADDPIVPIHSFARARFSRSTRLFVSERGGHLGYIGKTTPPDPDRRWMDWRVVDWVLHQSSASDCRWQIADCRFDSNLLQSAICHLLSAISNPPTIPSYTENLP